MASKAAEGHIASKQDLRSSWEGRGTSGGEKSLDPAWGRGASETAGRPLEPSKSAVRPRGWGGTEMEMEKNENEDGRGSQCL